MTNITENMSISEIIEELKKQKIKLWTEDGKLRYTAPQGVMNHDIMTILKNNKEAVINELQRKSNELKIVHDEEKRYEKFQLTEIQGAYLMGRNRSMEYGGVACHIYMDFEYDRLEKDKTQKVWNRIISENDMLHAVINREGWQKVLKEWDEFKINENDFTSYSPEKTEKSLEEVKNRMGSRLFNPSEFPLFEVELSQCANCTILHFSIDMLIVDWTSVWIMFSRFEQYYFGKETEKNELNITFRDYMETYKNVVNTDKYKKSEKYWKERIDEIPVSPQLPVQENSEYEFERYNFILSEKDWLGLKSASLEYGVTPVAALVTIYSSVLERFSLNKKFSLNLTTLNRMPFDEQVNSIIGDFTSISLLTMDNRGNKTFAERAVETNKNLFEILDNHLYTGIDVIREKARRDGGEKFLMPYVFTGTVGLINNEKSSKMRGKYRGGISQTPQVFIDCQVMDGDFGLLINWDIRKNIFPKGLAKKMFDIFSDRIKILSLSAENWKKSSLIDIPETKEFSDLKNYSEFPEHLIHSGIIKSAELYPDKIAVVDENHVWTYKELMNKASAIVFKLRELEIKAGSNIAVVMPKSVWQVATVIAVLSENCAYVPIDSNHAVNRCKLILNNANIDTVLSVSECENKLSEYNVINVDTLDETNENIIKADGNINDVAYIIHTSGSTGSPKGVVITHKGAVNTIEDINRRFNVSSDDSILGLSQLNFDLSVYDIFGVLSVGGTLIYPSEEKYTNPSHWSSLIEKYNITLWNSVPAFAQMLCVYLDSLEYVKFSKFKAVFLSGDWIPINLPDTLEKYMPDVRIACMGGATEASIWSNIHEYKGLKAGWNSIPYGRALLNQEMYVLDENLNICPVGINGMIYIAGYGLAKGYLNDENKTNEAFITSDDGKRLYKTGDMGRYNSDGEIEFLGRIDTQVKIRGHRIELGEIENCFTSYEEVNNSAVIVVKSDLISKIVAFIISKENINEEILKSRAEKDLPDYMIPDYFIFLEKMPLTANGKIDMHKLHEIAENRAFDKIKSSSEINKTMTQTEIKVADIVKDTLEIESVNPDVNLYEYGANSLLMAQLAGNLAGMLKDESAFDSILMSLFENPTVRSAAAAIDDINKN